MLGLDTSNDAAHCGACGVTCADGELCLEGACSIPRLGGTSLCEDQCVRLDNDPSHCGACDNTRADGESCRRVSAP